MTGSDHYREAEPVKTGMASNGTHYAVFHDGVEAGIGSSGDGYIDIGGDCPGPVISVERAEQFARALLAAVAWLEARRSERAEADPYRALREHLRWDQVTS